MNRPSGIAEIDQMIRDQIQENIHLDYKASKAISLTARDEIAKDVSAFANSDGPRGSPKSGHRGSLQNRPTINR